MLYAYSAGRYTTQHTITYVCCMLIQQVVIQQQHTISYVCCMLIQQVVIQHNILSLTHVVRLFSRPLYNTTYYDLSVLYVYSAGRYATQHTIS